MAYFNSYSGNYSPIDKNKLEHMYDRYESSYENFLQFKNEDYNFMDYDLNNIKYICNFYERPIEYFYDFYEMVARYHAYDTSLFNGDIEFFDQDYISYLEGNTNDKPKYIYTFHHLKLKKLDKLFILASHYNWKDSLNIIV